MSTIHAYAATAPNGALAPFSYEPGPLGPDDVEINVEHCGLCHSDISMLRNSWGMTQWPLVPGHEVVGRVAAVGPNVRSLAVGDRVGTGWFSASCMRCDTCLSGLQNLCPSAQGIIIGRHGGFADRVRVHWSWAIPLPDGLDSLDAGPLFCGGITVFGPIAYFGVKPTDRVGVVGIGGLGHMAVQFLAKWGCEVVAFTSSPDKAETARQLGAHSVVNSRDGAALDAVAGSFDFILSTVNVTLDWPKYLSALRANGRLHVVGA
ncbi:MAG: putative zinc-type alcohol dehydrogenase-like protein, partial [Myxococcota bacterium]